MKYTPGFLAYLIGHYSERLAAARMGGDVKEIAFLREELFKLKQL